MTTPDDLTLNELRHALGPFLPAEAAFEGWTDIALAGAAVMLGIPADRARLAVSGGSVQMIDLWFASLDRALEAEFGPEQIAALRVRDRVGALVMARLELVAPHREALRRALAILAMPTNAGRAAGLAWRTADGIWRLAGDRSTGFSHYSKRLTLAAVYGSTVLAFLQDESEDLADTREFLDRRIGDVMRFERLKSGLRPDRERRFHLSRFLGRLRYPAT